MRIFVQVSNYSDKSHTYHPELQTAIKVTYENGKTVTVLPTNPDEYIRKIQNNYALAEAINGFSAGYANSMAGNKTATYQSNTYGSVTGNSSSARYNQTEVGTVYYYDQAEVDRRNQIDQQNMTNRVNNFNSSLSSLNESMMRSNTIDSNQTVAGYVVFKAKGKNVKSIELTVIYAFEKHVLEF